MITITRTGKAGKTFRIMAVITMLLAMLGPVGTGSILAASVSSATFNGGPGTAVVGGTLFARKMQTVTLNVTTTSDTKCVAVSGAHSSTQKSNSGQSSWTFGFTTGNGDGLQSVQVQAFPNSQGNNCTGLGSSTVSASYTLDNTDPTLTAALSQTPNSAGWNNADVAITWTATDSGSGIASGPSPAMASVTAEGAGNPNSRTSTASDRVGNSASDTVKIKLDKTAPTITGSRVPGPNSYGWNNSDVVVSFVCNDSLSGIAAIGGCPDPTTVSSEAENQSVIGTASDVAGNSASATVSNISIDKTTPTLSGAPTSSPNGDGWYNGDVTIDWTAADAGSGIDPSTSPADSTISGEGIGLTASASVSDKAGNSTSATSSPAVKIDRTAPVTSASAPAGWNNQSVTVSLSATDNLSNVKTTHYLLDGNPGTGTSVVISSEGTHTLQFWSEDFAGNVENASAPGHTATVMIDLTPPTINHTQSPAANLDGWNNTDVTVTFTCGDQGGSGLASCGPSPQTITGEGRNLSATGTAVDNASNSATDPATVNIDRHAPAITGGATTDPNSNNWYNSDVTVQFSCTDPDLADSSEGSGVVSCGPDATLSNNAANQSVSGTGIDYAGNTSAHLAVGGINIDKIAPTLTGAATTSANGNGWYNSDVSIAWTCGDNLSGVDGPCPSNSVITGEGSNLSASQSISDLAGNGATSTVSGIKIDRTAPTITGEATTDPNENGWYNSSVTIHFICEDGLSGIVDGACPADVVLSSDSANQSVTRSVSDAAGNSASASVSGINIDRTAPAINGSRTPAANGNGWNNTAVSVSFTCTDSLSGIAPTGGCSGPTTLSNEGAGQEVTGTAIDLAGNMATATVSDINIDLTAPTITGAATTSPNAAGWYNTPVTVHFTCTDTLSGIPTGGCPADVVLSSNGANQSVMRSVSDAAGNSASASVSGINIDRTAPTLTLPNINVNSSSLSGAVVNYAGALATDTLSGFPGNVTTTPPTCSPASGSTFAPGSTTTVNCSATDRAGNTGSGSFTVTVNPFSFQGFFQPVDNGGVWNSIRGGQTVPIKWKLFMYQGGPEITNTASVMSGWPRYAGVTCSSLPEDTIEATSTGGTSLRYDASGQQFIYNWQTPTTVGCYRLDVKFVDGRTYSALFRTR
jgi:hypothetical protein